MSETRSSTNSNRPLLLAPAYRHALWGGDKLRDEYGHVASGGESPAESWLCSTHAGYVSRIASGEFKGRSLAELIKDHPDWLGSKYEIFGDLPVMLKLIDAKEALSLQVHPDDEYAAIHEEGGMGKTELWYVLDAEPGASLTYGFLHETNREEVLEWMERGVIGEHVRKLPVSRGDVRLVDAGAIHGIGAGILVAEVQENSNLTYRLWDYDRTDENGEKRELHIDKALDVLNYGTGRVIRRPIRQLRHMRGFSMELIGRCRYFETYRVTVNAVTKESSVSYAASDESYEIFLCMEGELEINCKGESIILKKGSCMFIPAHTEDILITGSAQLLRVRS